MILMTGHFCVFVFPRNQSLTVKVQGHWTAKTSSCSLFSGRMMHIAHKTGKHFPKNAAFLFFPHNSHWLLHYFSFTTQIAFKKSWAKCSQIGPDFIQTDQTPAPRDLRLPSTGQYQSHRFPQLMTFPQQQWPLLMSRWPLKVKGLGQLQSTSEQMENCDGLQINLLSSSLYPDQTSALPYMPFSHSNTSKLLKRLYL